MMRVRIIQSRYARVSHRGTCGLNLFGMRKMKVCWLSEKKAVKMARGQFVVFLDGDDCLASTEALSQLVECTKEHQADIYRFTVRSFGEDEKECEAFSRWLNKKGLDRSCSLDILRDCYLSFYRSWTLWASCYRTDVLKRAYSEVVDERYTCTQNLGPVGCITNRFLIS